MPPAPMPEPMPEPMPTPRLDPWLVVETTPIGERLLLVADDLFYRRGITAVGVELVADRAETTKRTLYQRFGSKDGLVEAYLRRRGSRWQRYLVDRLDGAGWSLAAFFRAAEDWAMDHRRGCAFVNAWAEVGDDAGSAAAEVVRDEKRWMRRLVVELVGGDPAVGAAVHQLYEGAQVAATVLGEPEAFRVALDAARTLVAGAGGGR